MILWLASYPRSGNTFLRVLFGRLFGRATYSIYEETADKEINAGLASPRRLAEMAPSPELFLVKTHELPGQDDHRAIHVVRDGRDSLVSYARFVLEYEKKHVDPSSPDLFASVLRELVCTDAYFGGWGRHALVWGRRKAPTAHIRFEDLIADPIPVLNEALQALGIRMPSIGGVVPSFTDLRRWSPGGFREGRIGGHRGQMSAELEDLFWARHGGAMRRFGYANRKREVDGPLVTVVTPSFNQGRFIRDTIESVLHQDYPHIEHLIIDGGSTDETADVVAEYGDRLVWACERDRGQSHAINKGFQRARGDIVCWVNSDDLLMPRAVSMAVDAFARQPQVGAVYGDGYLAEEDGSIKGAFPKAGRFNLWKFIYYSDYLLQPTVYVRRSVLDDVGLLDESLEWGMDWDLFIRIAKRYDLAYVPAEMAIQREYDSTKTASGGLARFRELVGIMRRHGTLRYPPAYLCYGIDTFFNVLRRRFPEWMWKRLSRRATLLFPIWKWFVLRTLVRWEGWYADDWATTTVRLLLPRTGKHIVIRGSLPEVFASLRGQSLRVRCNGRLIADAPLPPGDFEQVVPLAEPAAGGVVRIDLEASRYFVPQREGLNDDPRRLSYLLREVGWTAG